MPYAHKTSQPTKDALRRGDLVFAVNGLQNLGPTSATGYYNTINPPVNGYAIYSLGLNNNPIGMAVTTDDEIIRAANTLGGSVSSKSDALVYLAGRPSTWILHSMPNNRITEGLRLFLNAGDLSSYPTTGNTFYDLSGYNNNWTPLTNVTFNEQSFEFNGTTSYMQDGVSSFNPDSAPNVMEVLFKPMKLNGSRQAIFSDNYGPEYGIWIYSDNTLRGVAYTSVNTSNIEIGRWYYAVLNVQPGANKSSTDQTYIQFYVNGQFIGENNANTGNGMNDQPFSLGFDYKSNNPNDFFSGSIALARLSYGQYNQADVNQNYYQAPIITDGLVTALDFSNLVSYERGNSSGYSLTGSVGFDSFNSPTDTSAFGGGITCQETDEFIALDDKIATDYVSVECWWTRDSAGSGEDIVWNKESCWEIRDDGGNIRWALMANNKSWFWHDSTANISVGETVHFVLTYDGNYVKSYKNGELVQTYTYPSGGVLSSQTSCYPKLNSRACTRTSVQNPGNHTFYQFRIYDRALTDEEIGHNYSATSLKFI
jgi:hypothetical protein